MTDYTDKTVEELDRICADLQAECRRPLNRATGIAADRELDRAVEAYRAAVQRDGVPVRPAS